MKFVKFLLCNKTIFKAVFHITCKFVQRSTTYFNGMTKFTNRLFLISFTDVLFC